MAERQRSASTFPPAAAQKLGQDGRACRAVQQAPRGSRPLAPPPDAPVVGRCGAGKGYRCPAVSCHCASRPLRCPSPRPDRNATAPRHTLPENARLCCEPQQPQQQHRLCKGTVQTVCTHHSYGTLSRLFIKCNSFVPSLTSRHFHSIRSQDGRYQPRAVLAREA